METKYIYNSTYENFELFWIKYPRKIWHKTAFLKFKKIEKRDIENVFIWLEEYIKKWEAEETPKKYIPHPTTFLNQERYFDEIIIENDKKEKYKKFIEADKELKEIQKKEYMANKKKLELIRFYNWLNDENRRFISKQAEDKIKLENPSLYEKKWVFYEQYKKIIIRTILATKIKEHV